MERFSQEKITSFILGEGKFAVVALLVAAFLFGLVPPSLAKITDKEAKRIEDFLDIANVPILSKYTANQLKQLLNLRIRADRQSDPTYGILVLSAMNELELMDMVLSQRYKKEATEYFSQIISERIGLISHWKDVGLDMKTVVSGKITGPMSALTLHAFEITNKTIAIFTAFHVLQQEKLYDGLWFYFDSRISNETHEYAWDDAKIVIGFGATSNSLRFGKGELDKNYSKLESKFLSLWEEWGPYATPYGLKPEAKKLVQEELQNTIASAIESHKFAEEQKKSLADRIKELLDKIVEKIESINKLVRNAAKNLISRAGFLGARIELPEVGKNITEIASAPEAIAELLEAEPPQQPERLSLAEIQEELDDISESIDALIAEAAVLLGNEAEPEVLEASPPTLEPLAEASEPEAELVEVSPPTSGQLTQEPQFTSGSLPGQPAEPDSERLLPKILISEVAAGWNSAGNEFVELYNPSQTDPITLTVENFMLKLVDSGNQVTTKRVETFPQTIPPLGYLILVAGELTEETESLEPDLTFSSQLTSVSGVIITDGNDDIRDRVSWGKIEQLAPLEAAEGEGIMLENGLKTDQSLERKKGEGGNFIDTDNNSEDFQLQLSPNPTNSKGESLVKAGPPEIVPLEVLITEVQIQTSSSTQHDFIELYNKATDTADISGFQLKKRNSSGNESSVIVFAEGTTILGQSYFLWANSEYASSTDIQADSSTSQTLAKDNSIALLDKDKGIIDALAWGDWASGTSPFVEKAAFPENPGEKESLGRKLSTGTEEYIDTDDNSSDFEIQEPTPKEENKKKLEEEEEQPQQVSARDVVINEIAWMGTTNYPNDEWIELYNNSTSTIDLAGWTIKAADGTPSITISTSTGPTTTIEAEGFYLLERTDDNTVSNIEADQIYTGALGNGGEKLELLDSQGNLIDSVDTSSGWFSGVNQNLGTSDDPAWARMSMERIDPKETGTTSSNWMTHDSFTTNALTADNIFNKFILGTPKLENSRYQFASSTLIDGDQFVYMPAVWEKKASPYLIKGMFYVKPGAVLSIEPGVVVKFYPPELLPSPKVADFNVEGNLKAEGTLQEKIVFTALRDSEFGGNTIPEGDTDPVKVGDWRWLNFTSATSVSKMSNIIVRYGGYCDKYRGFNSSYKYYSAIKVENSSISLKDSKLEKNCGGAVRLINSFSTIDNVEFVENSHKIYQTAYSNNIVIRGGAGVVKNSQFSSSIKGMGIYLEEGAETFIENNTFEGTKEPIHVKDSAPIIRSNLIQNNYLNCIVLEGNIEQDLVLEESYSFIIDNFLKIEEEGSLEIRPGSVIKFGVKQSDYGNKNTFLKVEGNILAEGGSSTSTQIVFTSLKDDKYGGDTNGSFNLGLKFQLGPL